MRCPKCGKEIANDSQFCEFCGAKVSRPKSIKILWIILIVLLVLSAFCASSYYAYTEVAEAKAAREEAERLAEEAREQARQDSINAAIARQKQLQAEEKAAVAQLAKVQAEKEKAIAEREAAEMRRRNEERRRVEETRKAELKKKGLVDLGLPSGTLWKERDEEGGPYSYEDAFNRFHYNLPTKQQFEELINYCKWTSNGNGYNIVGPSGDMLVLSDPSAAYGACFCIFLTDDNGHVVGATGPSHAIRWGVYWSSTRFSNQSAWYLDLYDIATKKYDLCSKFQVRLVQQK